MFQIIVSVFTLFGLQRTKGTKAEVNFSNEFIDAMLETGRGLDGVVSFCNLGPDKAPYGGYEVEWGDPEDISDGLTVLNIIRDELGRWVVRS